MHVDKITDLMAEIFGKEHRTARRDRDFLANAGLLDLVAPGRGGARQWTPWGVANFLTAEACGLPMTDVDKHVPAINALPRVPGWCHDERPEAFPGMVWPYAKTFGHALALIIADHQRGAFRRFREPGSPSMMFGIEFDASGKSVSILLGTTRTATELAALHARTYGHREPTPFRAFATRHQLKGDISADSPECHATVFERIAEILGPIPIS